MLAAANLHFRVGETVAQGHMALPLDVRNRTARLEIRNENHAGAVQLLDSGGLERSVGLVSAGTQESEQPLLRALPARPYRSLVLPAPASAAAATPTSLPSVAVERRGLDAYAALVAGGDA